MGNPINHVTVVGRGTAGWSAAAYLNHRLQWGLNARPGVKVTVIESPSINSSLMACSLGRGVGDITRVADMIVSLPRTES